LIAYLEQQHARMSRALSQGLVQRGQRLRDLSRALPRPDSLLDSPRQRLDRASDRLHRAAAMTDKPRQQLDRAAARLDPALMAGVQQRKVRLAELSGGLRPATLRHRLAQDRQRLVDRANRLAPPILRQHDQQTARFLRACKSLSDVGHRQVDGWRAQITAAERLRRTLGYEATLERGFAVVRSGGAVVTNAETASVASELEIQFSDGKIKTRP
jgi:exodeoxyribonuclease VII large subunit